MANHGEEDELDAYMKTLDIPQDFLAAQQAPMPNGDGKAEEEMDSSSMAITLADLQEQLNSRSDVDQNADGDDDKFVQALLGDDAKTEQAVDSSAADAEALNSGAASTDAKSANGAGNDEEVLNDGMDVVDDTKEEVGGITSAMNLIAAKAKKKEIKPVDHSKISYPPFRKDFYVESPDVAALTEDEVKEIKEELEITIRGKNPPRPIQKWEECGLTAKLMETIQTSGWKTPFPIQRQAIPAIMSGRDVLGIAQTGSGKTLAYLVPLLRHVKDQPPVSQGQGPIALIIAPTRELATQIQKEVNRFKKTLGVECACLYGGQNVGDQIRELKKGVAVVVGTPGRMIDVLSMQNGRLLPLNRVTFTVLDEADRLFDMGFTPQVERILQNVRPDRQTVMFSATFPPHVEKLAKEALKSPLHIVVGNARSGAKVSADVVQIVELWKEDQKFLRVLQLLGEWYTKGNVLIFCDSQVRVDSLYAELERAGYPAVTLHAGKDQLDRDYAMKDFKNKTRTLMVATGVAGRGLDVPDLNLVINYNCPNHLEEYVHRVGRTGRAGKKGTAVTFVVDPDDAEYAADLVFALKASEQPVPSFLKTMADDFAAKLAAGTEKKHRSGYKTKGFAFEEGVDSGGYTGQLKKMRSALYDEIRAKDETEEAVIGPDEDGRDESEANDVVGVKTSPPPPNQPVTSSASSIIAPSEPIGSADPMRAEIEKKKAEEIAKAKALAAGLAVPPQSSSSFSSAPGGSSRFGRGPPSHPVPQFGHHEIDINELPAVVRQKIMAKRFMNQIESEFKVSLTVKGRLVAAGEKPGPAEQKLTLIIDASDVQDARRAVAELNRLIHEEAKKISVDQAFDHMVGGGSARYKI